MNSNFIIDILGFYCISGSNTSTPMHTTPLSSMNISTIGSICPPGHYCPEGSIQPTPCPKGTFNGKVGADQISECISCPAGHYCEGMGNAAPTGLCLDGYYCVGGSYLPTQNETEPGHYSIKGATNQTECSPGTYNMQYRQTSCSACPEGFYCPISGLVTYIPYPCTVGHYCPIGTIDPVKCPAGTFSDAIGNKNVSECTPCTSGYYCQLDGLTEVSGPCDAGFYCTIGSRSRTQPVPNSEGGPCPKGHYCLTGSPVPLPCPRGTYMSSTLNIGQKFFKGKNYLCDLCPSGKSCDGIGLSDYTSVVAAGYWSITGANTDMPICNYNNCTDMYGICPKGSYCPPDSTVPLICAAGTYQDNEGQGTCKVFFS
jgi:hypothetical protein